MRPLFYLTPLLLLFALAACDVTDSSDAPRSSLSTTAVGVQGPGGGGGGGGGDLYADLVFVYRDVDGLPLLRPVGEEYCLQPISYEPVPGISQSVINEGDGKEVWLLPLVGDLKHLNLPIGDEVEVCDVAPQYASYMKEVEFGRLNMGRAPDEQLDRGLAEVLAKIDASSFVLLDHAGRLAPDDVPIDAPRENLAVHRELLLVGQGGIPRLPEMPWSKHAFLDHAASGLGAAADKFGRLNLDIVVYNNRILELPQNTTAMATLASYTDAAGIMHGEPGETYLLYSDYRYDRASTFPGCVAGYRLVNEIPVPFMGTLMNVVFGGEDFTGGNVYGFAQRADDARAMILFEHDSIITRIDRIGETAVCDYLAADTVP